MEEVHIQVVDKASRSQDGTVIQNRHVYVVDRNGEPIGELMSVQQASLTVSAEADYPILHLAILVDAGSLSEFVIDREHTDSPVS